MQKNTYTMARETAEKLLSDGDIVAIHSSNSHEYGRQIHIETEQGIDPEPLYRESDSEGNFNGY